MTQPKRACTSDFRLMTKACWSAIVLQAVSDYRLSIEVHSDSVSVDPDWNAARFAISVRIQVEDSVSTLDVEAVCQPLVRVRALYEIPGRTELCSFRILAAPTVARKSTRLF